MADIDPIDGVSGRGKSQDPIESPNSPDPANFKSHMDGPSAAQNEGFVEKAWGFSADEAKKFIQQFSDFIISRIKLDDQRAQETAQKLKEAETEGDIE